MLSWVSKCSYNHHHHPRLKVMGTEQTEAMIKNEENEGMVEHESSFQEGCRKKVWPVIKTLVSILVHLLFLASLGVILWCFFEKHSDRTFYIVFSLLAGVSYVVILIEAAASDTYKALRNFTQKLSAETYIDKVKSARPHVRWQAECYHYEYTDEAEMNAEQLNRQTRTRARQRVVTGREKESFNFTMWRDYTRDIRDLLRKPVIRFECSKVFIFKNESSKNQYMQQYQAFRERIRRRDEFMEHDEELNIPNFQPQLTVCVTPNQKPCWLSDCIFWLCTMLLCTWFYRIAFKRICCKVYIVFVKQLEV